MKTKTYCAVLVLLSFRALCACQPPVPGIPVWNIAAQNVSLTNTIESVFEDIDFDFTPTLTVLDPVLELISNIESKADMLLTNLHQLYLQVQADVDTAASASSLMADFAMFDITQIFTALDGLEQDIVSQMDRLNVQLITISDNLAQLIATQLVHDATAASQLEQLSSDLIELQSVLETIDFTQLDPSESVIDLLTTDIHMLANDITQLNAQLALGFQGTFTALDVNLELAQQFNSLIEAIPMSFTQNIQIISNALDELELTMETISSQVDDISAGITAIDSVIDQLDSSANQILSQFDNVENSLVHVESIAENVVDQQKLSISTLQKDNSLLDYMLDASLFVLSVTISSKLTVIDTDIVDQNSTLDSVSAELSSIEHLINDASKGMLSQLEAVDSKIDLQLQEILSIESTVNIIDSKVQAIIDGTSLLDHALDNANSINSIIDQLPTLPTMSSQLEELDDQLFVINSLVDVITPMAQTEFSYAINVESRLEHITVDSSNNDAVLTHMSEVVTAFASIESKVDLYTSLTSNLLIEAQELVDDMQATWTILSVIENSLATSNDMLSSATELLQDDIEKAASEILSLSGVFTVIDSILAQEDTINTQVDTYTSLIAAFNADLSTDFGGIFTALNTTLAQSQASAQILSVAQSTLANISSELTIIQNSLGKPIYASQLPLTITTPGRYYLAENINFLPSTGTAITISTNDVTIDLNGNILNYAGVGASVSAILINNVDNTRIINGTISNFTNRSILTGAGQTTNSIMKNLVLILGGVTFVGTGRNHKFNDNWLISSNTLRLINIQGLQTNLIIDNCVGIGNATGGFAFGVQVGTVTTTTNNIQISNCYFKFHPASTTLVSGIGFNNPATAINTLIQNNIVISNNAVINLSSPLQNMVITKNILTSLFTSAGINLNPPSGALASLVIQENNIMNTAFGITNTVNYTTASTVVANFNRLINNTSGNIRLSTGRATFLGNFAFNINALPVPNNTNYNVQGSTANITGKFITVSQRGSFIGVPTYWHNINMLP